jgi:type IX secretion system PorP/SprF family membrane protein
MNKIRLYINFTLLILTGTMPLNTFGQYQPDIGNYMFFLPLINPGAAGSLANPSGVIFGRKQWFSVEGAPSNFGAEFVKPASQSALGGLLTQESIGVHMKQKLFGTYSYRVNITRENHLAFGMSGGIIVMEDNYNKVHTTEESDAQFTGSKTILGPDFSFGMLYFTDNFNLGFSIPSMIHNTVISNNGELKGKTNVLLSSWQYYLHGGYNYQINKEYTLLTSSLIRINVNNPIDVDVNVQLEYLDLIGGGISYRTKSEMIFFANIRLNDIFRLGYCYHSYFNINGRYLMGHEIILTFSNSKSKPALIQNPRF